MKHEEPYAVIAAGGSRRSLPSDEYARGGRVADFVDDFEGPIGGTQGFVEVVHRVWGMGFDCDVSHPADPVPAVGEELLFRAFDVDLQQVDLLDVGRSQQCGDAHAGDELGAGWGG